MSDKHDHPHPHPAPAASVPPPEPPVAPLEDAGAVALEEALSSSFRVVKFLMILLVGVFFLSGLFTVDPNEVAVVLRFGKPLGVGPEQILKPGLHFALPQPIDEIVRLPVGQSITVVSSNGWHSFPAGDESAYPSLRLGVDRYNLTGDASIIHTRATLTYRLTPDLAVDHYFNFMDSTRTLRSALENALIYAASRSQADEAIFTKSGEFQELVRERFIRVARDEMRIPVAIDSFEVERIPPPMVKDAFDELTTAQQKANEEISKAQGQATTNRNYALSRAQVIVNEAMTRSNQVVLTVQAQAQAFTNQLPEYLRNPQLIKERMLTATMKEILSQARDKFFVPENLDELRLQLNREPLSERK